MTIINRAFRKIVHGEGRARGSLEPTLTMLLIGLVMGVLLQWMNVRNRDLVIDNLETRIRTLEMRLWIEKQTSYRPGRDGSPDGSDFNQGGEGTSGVLICDAG
ncbi:MAG: hypothetical protein KC931_12920 [Candidatus Omnitrophica bacterium]|nr:hypothetical protein [Candidatus Omnitrophota bacterium]